MKSSRNGDTILPALLLPNVNNTEGQIRSRSAALLKFTPCLHYDVHNRRCNKPASKVFRVWFRLRATFAKLVSKSITSLHCNKKGTM